MNELPIADKNLSGGQDIPRTSGWLDNEGFLHQWIHPMYDDSEIDGSEVNPLKVALFDCGYGKPHSLNRGAEDRIVGMYSTGSRVVKSNMNTIPRRHCKKDILLWLLW